MTPPVAPAWTPVPPTCAPAPAEARATDGHAPAEPACSPQAEAAPGRETSLLDLSSDDSSDERVEPPQMARDARDARDGRGCDPPGQPTNGEAVSLLDGDLSSDSGELDDPSAATLSEQPAAAAPSAPFAPAAPAAPAGPAACSLLAGDLSSDSDSEAMHGCLSPAPAAAVPPPPPLRNAAAPSSRSFPQPHRGTPPPSEPARTPPDHAELQAGGSAAAGVACPRPSRRAHPPPPSTLAEGNESDDFDFEVAPARPSRQERATPGPSSNGLAGRRRPASTPASSSTAGRRKGAAGKGAAGKSAAGKSGAAGPSSSSSDQAPASRRASVQGEGANLKGAKPKGANPKGVYGLDVTGGSPQGRRTRDEEEMAAVAAKVFGGGGRTSRSRSRSRSPAGGARRDRSQAGLASAGPDAAGGNSSGGRRRRALVLQSDSDADDEAGGGDEAAGDDEAADGDDATGGDEAAGGGELQLPCEFCEELVTAEQLDRHQRRCELLGGRGRDTSEAEEAACSPSASSPARFSTDLERLPCEFCQIPQPLARLTRHQQACPQRGGTPSQHAPLQRVPPIGELTKLKLLQLNCTKVTDAGCAFLASAVDNGALPALRIGELFLFGTPGEAAAKTFRSKAFYRVLAK